MNALPSLYILAGEYQEAAARLADLDLPPEVIADTLEGMAGEVEVKATNVAMFVRNLEATAEQIKSAEEQMAARRKAIEKRASSVRDYLMTNMQRTGITKIECPYFRISLRTNPPSVIVDDAAALPVEFIRQQPVPPPLPDKAAIKEAISSGREVPGAHIVCTHRLEIK